MIDHGYAGPVDFRWSKLNNGRVDVDGGSGTGYRVCQRRHRWAERPLRVYMLGDRARAIRRCKACPATTTVTIRGPQAERIRARFDEEEETA